MANRGRGKMTRVIEERKQGGWTVQVRRHKTTGGLTVYITGPGILSATLPVETAFDLTECLDDICDAIEDGIEDVQQPVAGEGTRATAGDMARELGL